MNNVMPIVSADVIEKVLVSGDLSKLTPEQRLSYIKAVCDSVGLNPLTRPLEYITLNGKLTLYAKRDATDQFRKRDNVSIRITSREVINGVYVVTAQASMPDGRCDESTGAVFIDGLKGELLANAYLKCETKAKRRVTLSICGLGMLDETEVESVQANAQQTEAAKLQRAVELLDPVDPGEYVVPFGQKFKGQKIKDTDMFELNGYIDWLVKQAKAKGVPISGQVEEFFNAADAFLKSREVKR